MGTIIKIFRDIPKLNHLARISTSVITPTTVKNEVKRPPSPFALFFQEKWQNLKTDNPEMNQNDLMKLASNMWKNSGSYEQQRYRDIFDDKMSTYKQSVKTPPKRPINSYIRFYMDNLDSLSVIYPNVTDRSKKTAEMWKNLSDFEKAKYKREYERDLGEFIQNLTDEDKELIQNRRQSLNDQRERRAIKKYGKAAWNEKPKVGAPNSYIAYIREHSALVPKGENSFVYLSKSWKELSDSEKSVYQEKADQLFELEQQKLSEWEAKNVKV